MTIDLDRFNKLVKERDQAARDKERAKGAAESILARLKKEHSCETIEEAEAEANKAEKQANKLEGEFEEELEKIEREFTNEDLNER